MTTIIRYNDDKNSPIPNTHPPHKTANKSIVRHTIIQLFAVCCLLFAKRCCASNHQKIAIHVIFQLTDINHKCASFVILQPSIKTVQISHSKGSKFLFSSSRIQLSTLPPSQWSVVLNWANMQISICKTIKQRRQIRNACRLTFLVKGLPLKPPFALNNSSYFNEKPFAIFSSAIYSTFTCTVFLCAIRKQYFSHFSSLS